MLTFAEYLSWQGTSLAEVEAAGSEDDWRNLYFEYLGYPAVEETAAGPGAVMGGLQTGAAWTAETLGTAGEWWSGATVQTAEEAGAAAGAAIGGAVEEAAASALKKAWPVLALAGTLLLLVVVLR